MIVIESSSSASERSPGLIRRICLAIGLIALLSAVLPATATHAAVAADAQTRMREILFPVVGPNTSGDTFGACRSGCARGHEGTDIMAAKLTPIVAVRDAKVTGLETTAAPDGSQGNYIFITDDEGWTYRYIHINNDTPHTDDGANPSEWLVAPGIERGSRVRAGQLISWVGDSGNAEGTAPHLHFEIYTPDGEVINSYKSLRAATRLTAPLTPGAEAYSSSTARAAFVEALFTDFLGRTPSSAERTARVSRLSVSTREALIDEFATSDEWVRGLVDGYYQSTLGRSADEGGRAHWIRLIQSGRTPASVAAEFYASAEYHALAGGTDRAWISDLYAELLHRQPDPGGLEHWLKTRAAGTSRQRVASDFYQSIESRQTRVTGLYQALLGRAPDAGGRAYWAGLLADGHDLRLAKFLAASDEYVHRATVRFD